MEKNYPNKAMKPEDIKTKIKNLTSYFFAGGGEYNPISIEAESLEEATAQYEKIKKPIKNNL